MSNKKLIFFLSICVILVSCNRRITAPGTYVLGDKTGNDTLRINIDGTFTYKGIGGEDGCGMYWEAGSAKGQWKKHKNNISFYIDADLKPIYTVNENLENKLTIKFESPNGQKIRSRTTTGITRNNKFGGELKRLNHEFNDSYSEEYSKIDKIKIHVLGTDSNLYIPTFGKPLNIKISNFRDYVFYEIEESSFTIQHDKIEGLFFVEYAKQEKKIIFHKIQDSL